MGVMGMAVGRAAEPPPSATSEDIPVTASVDADAILVPR
jgi:hypothetical protein